MVAQLVAPIGVAQGPRLERVPVPRDVVGVEVSHERGMVVDRREVERPVIASAGGATADRVQAVGPGRPGNGAEPAIADRELARQVVVDRDIGGVVVTNHATRIRILDLVVRERLGEARDEAVHLAAPDLEVDGAGGVIGIVLDHRAVEMVDRIAAPIVLVGELRPQTIDIVATTFKREIPQHVVEGAILEHQYNDVVDLLEVGHAGVLGHYPSFVAVEELADVVADLRRARFGLPRPDSARRSD